MAGITDKKSGKEAIGDVAILCGLVGVTLVFEYLLLKIWQRGGQYIRVDEQNLTVLGLEIVTMGAVAIGGIYMLIRTLREI